MLARCRDRVIHYGCSDSVQAAQLDPLVPNASHLVAMGAHNSRLIRLDVGQTMGCYTEVLGQTVLPTDCGHSVYYEGCVRRTQNDCKTSFDYKGFLPQLKQHAMRYIARQRS